MYSAKKKASLHNGLSLEICPSEDCLPTAEDVYLSCGGAEVRPNERKVCCMSRLTESVFVQPFSFLCVTTDVLLLAQDKALTNEIVALVNSLGTSAPKFVVFFVKFPTGSDRNSVDVLKLAISNLVDATRELGCNVRALTVPCGGDVPDGTLASCLSCYSDRLGDDAYEFWCGGVQFLVVNSMYASKSTEFDDVKTEQTEWVMAKLLERQHDHGTRVVVMCDAFTDLQRASDELGRNLEFQIDDDSKLLMPNLLATGVTHVIDCCPDNPRSSTDSPRQLTVPMGTRSEGTPLLLVSVAKDSMASVVCTSNSLQEHLLLGD